MNFFSLFKRNLIYKLKRKKKIDSDNHNGSSLDKILAFYGSDKAENTNLDNKDGHGYSKFYSDQLKEIKSKEINILEIGSYAGASAAAFSKYFRNSKIFCFDINISNFKFSSQKIKVYGLDVNNRKKVNNTLERIFKENEFKEFDLIIDDGSHLLSDILKSFNYFFKFVSSHGIYVIEDYKFPNYFDRNKDLDEILVDELLENIKRKKFFLSNIFNTENQNYLFNSIDSINQFKGSLNISDICFIKKK